MIHCTAICTKTILLFHNNLLYNRPTVKHDFKHMCVHFVHNWDLRNTTIWHWCGIFHYHRWKASIKPRLLFSHAGFASWGLSSVKLNLLQLVFSASVAGVMSCPVLHHCVVICSGPQGSWIVCCLHLGIIEFR